MKKFLAMALAAVMVLALAACGSKNDTADDTGDAQDAQGGEQTPHRRLAGFDRRHVFGDQGLQLGALQRHAAPHAAQEQRHVGQVTAEGFQHARGHEMVERRDRLPAVLLVLVGLEDDRGQRGVALDRLRRASRSSSRIPVRRCHPDRTECTSWSSWDSSPGRECGCPRRGGRGRDARPPDISGRSPW